jgi:uncharacterized membrane protein
MHGVLWKVTPLGQVSPPVDLGAAPGDVSSTAFVTNDAGDIVGEARDTAGVTRAVRWKVAGDTVTMTNLGAARSSAAGLSDRGRISGWVTGTALTAAVWDVGFLNAAAAVPVLTPDLARGLDVNDAGEVVGMVELADGTQEGFVAIP